MKPRTPLIPLLPTLAVSLAIAAGAPVQAQSADPAAPGPDRLSALEAQVRAQSAEIARLRDQVAALEKKLAEMPARPAAPAAPAVNPALEEPARAAVSDINRLVAAGDMEGAKQKMTEAEPKYGSTQAWKSLGRLPQELAVIGRNAPSPLKVEKWYQGESSVDPSKAKATLLVFWEQWCPHCQREVPKLEAIWQKYREQGLQVVGLTRLTRNTTEEQALAFIKERGVSYPMAKENGEMSAYFNVSGIPAAAILKDGKVVWRGNPARISEESVAKYL